LLLALFADRTIHIQALGERLELVQGDAHEIRFPVRVVGFDPPVVDLFGQLMTRALLRYPAFAGFFIQEMEIQQSYVHRPPTPGVAVCDEIPPTRDALSMKERFTFNGNFASYPNDGCMKDGRLS
jgi:hypothetical protein